VTDPIPPAGGRHRGGPQLIPRPAGWQPGGPPPWGHLDAQQRSVRLEEVASTFASLAPPVHSARERLAGVTRASAVLAPLFEQEGEPWVVLTRRTRHLRSHAGEMSFPGGGQEPEEDLHTTALREAQEEVALDPGLVSIVGELDHLSTMTSGSVIVPYVGLLSRAPTDLRANADEVDAIRFVSLAELLDPEVYREEVWPLFGAARPIYFFELDGDTVWGATGAMLRQLLGFLTGTVARGDIGHA